VANMNVEGYAGDLTAEESWEVLKSEENAVLVDVRSAAEWSYVGITDLSSLGKETAAIEWKRFSGDGMVENPTFVEQVKAACPNPEAKVLSLCRSGVRSIATSKALTEAGFTQAYNVLEGFEGDKDTTEHRGQIGGWKFHGLPWKQN
jgi:rhodanese-related sulfurtransferase